ncbi:hypothetical protein BO99DRAFT_384495 [Aspergillus violaceofuscus CBS 115571]|uniref:Uncharacterized protein n=1 Tax=Aspergillus violaceofuscus (strain CBS 115571) TaxID=1450538 RepID=A0A2V5I5Q6_ASPV1|nr:hypothetical protein BO99DRAFT_384495 [Aspergillus violaceofuscus CBS 115571]
MEVTWPQGVPSSQPVDEQFVLILTDRAVDLRHLVNRDDRRKDSRGPQSNLEQLANCIRYGGTRTTEPEPGATPIRYDVLQVLFSLLPFRQQDPGPNVGYAIREWSREEPMAANEVPEPDADASWRALPSQPSVVPRASKGRIGALVRAAKGIPPCVWVVNQHSEEITVVVSKYRPNRLVSGGGISASSTGAGVNISTMTFLSPVTKKKLAPSALDPARSRAVFPLWTRNEGFGVISILKGPSESLYIENDRIPIGATAYFKDLPDLELRDYYGQKLEGETAQTPLRTANTSKTGTSVYLEGQEMYQYSADNKSVYTSNAQRSRAYVQELATSLFKNSETPDAKSLERIRKSLPDLLRGFAQRLGGEDPTSSHIDELMRFVTQKRQDIARAFGQYYLDDAKALQRQRVNGNSSDELSRRWRVDQVLDDPNSATARQDDVPPTDDDDQSAGDEDDDGGDLDDTRLVIYRNIVANSAAFQWLLRQVHRETSLTTLEATSMKAISTQIRQILYTQRENRLVSSHKGPPNCLVMFQSDWDPLGFIRNQSYKEEPDEAIGGAIVIVQGTNEDVEAMSCSEYVSRTWPLLGERFMGLVKNTVQSNPGLRCSVILFDRTKITAWVEPSGCFSLEAAGVVESLIEVGEVFAFIVAALRSAQADSIVSVYPTIDSGAETSHQTRRLTIRLQHSKGTLQSTGRCWQGLFSNPVVVLGFPVQRRLLDQGPGLEISLATLAALVGTRRIAVFCGEVFLQGFCTILVPTKYSGDTVHWHVLFNEDGSRISITDSRVRKVVEASDLSKHLTPSNVETARHIVGWCEHARNYAGKDASYDIKRPDLRSPGPGFAFDRISISAGKIVSVGASVAVGTKDKPARAAKKTDYHKQLEWAEERFVVLYDCKDHRAWLIDGLSALLHLLRAYLAHRRKAGREVLFREGDIEESDTPYTGKTAANAFFQNRTNMGLKIYEKWNRTVEETIQKGDEPFETIRKTQRTWEQLPDAVGDIYITLGMLFDIQTDRLTADGFGAKIRKSPRRRLEGWDFQQVATSADPTEPKAASLSDIGLGWVDLVRAINAITLFGQGFGEILQPVDTAQVPVNAQSGPAVNAPQGRARCERWTTLPKDKDLLATTIPVIQDVKRKMICQDPDDNKKGLWKLCDDIYWHSPDKVFEGCDCGTASSGKQCDRVQVLLPTSFPKIFARNFHSPRVPLPNHGAVIFGHSMRFPLLWKVDAGSVPTESNLQPSQLTSQSSHQSNNGVGTSAASSSVWEDSANRLSILGQNGSKSTHSRAASSPDRASVTDSEGNTTCAKSKTSENIIKRIGRMFDPSTKPVKAPTGPVES